MMPTEARYLSRSAAVKKILMMKMERRTIAERRKKYVKANPALRARYGLRGLRLGKASRPGPLQLLRPVLVQSMWRTWVNRSVPAMAGARLVVSDMGESLSPK